MKVITRFVQIISKRTSNQKATIDIEITCKMCRFNWFFYGIWTVLLCIQCIRCFEDSVNNCLNRKSETKFELPLDIVNENGALELWIQYNGKYDLYQTYHTGHIYHSDLGLSEKASPRTGADRANCSNYIQSTPSWYGCPYSIAEDDQTVNITLESFLNNVIYSIDKTTKEIVKDSSPLYGQDQATKQIDCVNEVANYDTTLPIEVVRKENHLEVTVKYQGKYDFYNTISLGTVCGIQYQLDEKPNPTIEDYAHCSKCGNAAELYAWCPFKISENENVVTFSIEAFFYNNIYTINKSSNEVQYEKTLVGKDPHVSFEEDINECKNGLSATNHSLPIQLIRNDDFLELWVKRDDKYDVFETDVSGSVCKMDLQSSRDPSVLLPRAPADCFRPGLDVPYYFLCPYQILEDDDYVYFRIHSSDMYLYAFNKSTSELVFRQFPTIYDSGHQGTVSYLRTVVLGLSAEEFLRELS